MNLINMEEFINTFNKDSKKLHLDKDIIIIDFMILTYFSIVEYLKKINLEVDIIINMDFEHIDLEDIKEEIDFEEIKAVLKQKLI